MEIREFQEKIEAIYFERDSARGLPGTHMWFMEEVGELARLMARMYGDQSFKGDAAGKAELEMEMADVLFVLICLANQTDVDLEGAFALAMEKRTARDRERHQSNPKLK